MEMYFSRKDTKIVKGIAVLLMLLHHLWGFPERIAGGELNYFINIFGHSSLTYLGGFGKICVSIFYFVGGYGMYKSSTNKEFDIVKKLKDLYISYWKVFCVFIPIAFVFFSSQPVYCKQEYLCTVYADFSWKEVLSSFLGFSSRYNAEWWFFKNYIVAIFAFPILRKIISKFSPATNIWIVICGSIFMTNIFPALGNISLLGDLNSNFLYKNILGQASPYFACFFMGMVMAKDDLMERLHYSLKKNKIYSFLKDIFIIGFIVFLRSSVTGASCDIIYVPVLIVLCLDLLEYLKIIKYILEKIGQESTNMWLIHSFYCYYFYAFVKIVTAPRYGILCLGVLVILTYLTSITLTRFWNVVSRVTKQKLLINHKFFNYRKLDI